MLTGGGTLLARRRRALHRAGAGRKSYTPARAPCWRSTITTATSGASRSCRSCPSIGPMMAGRNSPPRRATVAGLPRAGTRSSEDAARRRHGRRARGGNWIYVPPGNPRRRSSPSTPISSSFSGFMFAFGIGLGLPKPSVAPAASFIGSGRSGSCSWPSAPSSSGFCAACRAETAELQS